MIEDWEGRFGAPVAEKTAAGAGPCASRQRRQSEWLRTNVGAYRRGFQWPGGGEDGRAARDLGKCIWDLVDSRVTSWLILPEPVQHVCLASVVAPIRSIPSSSREASDAGVSASASPLLATLPMPTVSFRSCAGPPGGRPAAGDNGVRVAMLEPGRDVLCQGALKVAGGAAAATVE